MFGAGVGGEKFVEVWAGQMLAKYGNREEAAEVYCASEGLTAGDWEAYWQLGRFLLTAGLHARAIEFLNEAVRIQPRAIDAHLDLARGFEALGRSGEARKSLEEARQLDPRAKL
jgi:tetratricopeptide (TPR) repeat protein